MNDNLLKILRSRWLGLFLFGCSAILAAYPFLLERHHENTMMRVEDQIQKLFEADLSQNHLNEAAYRELALRYPRIAYVVLANYQTGKKFGFINPSSLVSGAHELVNWKEKGSQAELLTLLLQKDKGFSGPYLDVTRYPFLPFEHLEDQTPIGLAKVGYTIPGYPYGRCYAQLFWSLASAFGLLSLLWAGFSFRKQNAPSQNLEISPSENVEGLDLLEMELFRGEQGYQKDADGRSWKMLFNGHTLDGLKPKGKWHVSEGDLIGQPWASSIVSTNVAIDGSFQFCFRAKKIAGSEGFLALFPIGELQLAWVIGGWRNQYSQIGGYPETKRECHISKGKWYPIKVSVSEREIEGFIHDTSMWKIQRKDLKDSSPDVGFLQGVGVAVWDTVCRFQELRFSLD